MGKVQLFVPASFRYTPHTFCGPIWSSTEGPSGKVQLFVPASFRYTPHTFQPSPALPRIKTYSRILVGEYGWSLRQANSSPPHFGTPLTRCVAP